MTTAMLYQFRRSDTIYLYIFWNCIILLLKIKNDRVKYHWRLLFPHKKRGKENLTSRILSITNWNQKPSLQLHKYQEDLKALKQCIWFMRSALLFTIRVIELFVSHCFCCCSVLSTLIVTWETGLYWSVAIMVVSLVQYFYFLMNYLLYFKQIKWK